MSQEYLLSSVWYITIPIFTSKKQKYAIKSTIFVLYCNIWKMHCYNTRSFCSFSFHLDAEEFMTYRILFPFNRFYFIKIGLYLRELVWFFLKIVFCYKLQIWEPPWHSKVDKNNNNNNKKQKQKKQQTPPQKKQKNKNKKNNNKKQKTKTKKNNNKKKKTRKKQNKKKRQQSKGNSLFECLFSIQIKKNAKCPEPHENIWNTMSSGSTFYF